MTTESNENGVVPSLVPTGLADDQLLAVAAAAERRIEAVNKIKKIALKVTNNRDWTDQGGNPYLQVSGSEKVARLFGISWRLDEPIREDHDDGHFSYSFKGYFSMGTAEIEVMGTRSSQDPFFRGSREQPKPPSEIDRNDVKKGAMTNCIGNGITRLLGIRSLTWEDLAESGISRDRLGKVNFRTSDPHAAAKLPNYGKYKGMPMDDPSIPVSELRYYLSGAEKSISDPEKDKYKSLNEKMRDALIAELAKREDKPEGQGAPSHDDNHDAPSPEGSDSPSGPQLTADNVCQQFVLVESMPEWADVANAWQDEAELHSDDDRAKVKAAAEAAKKRLAKKK